MSEWIADHDWYKRTSRLREGPLNSGLMESYCNLWLSRIEHRLFRPVSCGTSQVQALPCTLLFISIIYPVFINVTCWFLLLTTRSAVQLAVPVGLDAVQVYLPESSADTASRLHCALLCSHHVLTLSHSNSSFPFLTHWIDGDGTPTNTVSLKKCFYFHTLSRR